MLVLICDPYQKTRLRIAPQLLYNVIMAASPHLSPSCSPGWTDVTPFLTLSATPPPSRPQHTREQTLGVMTFKGRTLASV